MAWNYHHMKSALYVLCMCIIKNCLWWDVCGIISLHFYPKKGFFYKLSFPLGGSLNKQ